MWKILAFDILSNIVACSAKSVMEMKGVVHLKMIKLHGPPFTGIVSRNHIGFLIAFLYHVFILNPKECL